jgi:hypothetical protein
MADLTQHLIGRIKYLGFVDKMGQEVRQYSVSKLSRERVKTPILEVAIYNNIKNGLSTPRYRPHPDC